jgi:hypothetical protein
MLKSGTYDVNIDPDSGLPMTAQIRKQNAVQTFQLLSPNPFIDKYKLTNMLLRELHGPMYDDLLLSQEQVQKNQEAAQKQQQQAMAMEMFAKHNPKTTAARQSR